MEKIFPGEPRRIELNKWLLLLHFVTCLVLAFLAPDLVKAGNAYLPLKIAWIVAFGWAVYFVCFQEEDQYSNLIGNRAFFASVLGLVGYRFVLSYLGLLKKPFVSSNLVVIVTGSLVAFLVLEWLSNQRIKNTNLHIDACHAENQARDAFLESATDEEKQDELLRFIHRSQVLQELEAKQGWRQYFLPPLPAYGFGRNPPDTEEWLATTKAKSDEEIAKMVKDHIEGSLARIEKQMKGVGRIQVLGLLLMAVGIVALAFGTIGSK